jgi:hypothetical protein
MGRRSGDGAREVLGGLEGPSRDWMSFHGIPRRVPVVIHPPLRTAILCKEYKMFYSPGFAIVSACPLSDPCEGSPPRPPSSLVRKMSLPGYTQLTKEDYGASSTTSPDDDESEPTTATDSPASSAQPHPSSAQSALSPLLATFVLVGRFMIYSEKKAISHRSRNRLVRVPSLPLLATLLYTCHPSIPIGLSLTPHN